MQVSSISLKELLVAVKAVISDSFPGLYWVRADISDLREDATRGHCYLELVEKTDGRLIEAKVRASIWANTYRMLKPMFIQATGQPLRTGMKVLVQVSVTFHEQYGMSCVIHDIDPTFTLGDIARKKQETIQRLKEDGIWEMNKSLELPYLIQRIAVISSKTAAGYEDFCNQLQNAEYPFQFKTTLYPAIVQGEQAAESVVASLDKIFAQYNDYDVVVIIRGGGASTDLMAFDEYTIAASVAQFPLPILTGIGHERDESVTDMVAHTRCKTPTAVAAFILDQMNDVAEHLLTVEKDLRKGLTNLLEEEKSKISQITDRLFRSCTYCTGMETQKLEMMRIRLHTSMKEYLSKKSHRLEVVENSLRLLSPEFLLKRGYSITMKDGKIVKDKTDVKSGDCLETVFCNGVIESIAK